MINKFIRPELKKFKQYTPSPTLQQIVKEVGIPMEKIIKADSGENLYVEKYQSKKNLQQVKFSFYPDPVCRNVRRKLALYTGFGEEWIMCGNGSDELIDLLFRIVVSPGEEIITVPPTFSMYEFYGQLSGAKIKKVTRNKDFAINIRDILKNISAKTKIVFIDSPGNPSTVVTPRENIKQLLSKKTIIVIDEAYYEYCNQTVLPLLRKYPNLIVLRSFSKWAGLAGLRIGYMVANPEIIKILMSVKAPYNVNSLAQEAACYVLDNKEKFLREIKRIMKFRKILIDQLSRLPYLQVYKSEGAYVLFKPQNSAGQLQEFLKKNGILVKLINQPLLENCLRVNLLKLKDISKLIYFLRKFYEKISI